MALDSDTWRPTYVSDWDWLEDCQPLTQRLWSWLTTSRQSTATGLMRVRQHAATGALKTKPTAYLAALSELEERGKILVQQHGDGWVDLYLTLWLRRQCGVRDTQRQALRRLIERFADGAAKSQAIEDWTVWDSGCRQADARLKSGRPQPEPQQEQEQEQKTETQLPAAQEAVASATPATPAKTTTPEQLQLAVKEPKPKKVKPKSVEDAEMLYATWNQGASQVEGWTHCSRCDGAVRSVLGRAYKIMVEALPLDDDVPDQPVVDALKWALCDPYWSGAKFGKPWAILTFFASHNVDKMLADYNRARRGEYNG